MRLPILVTLAIVLAAPTLTHADTVLVGSEQFVPGGGSGFCPTLADCEEVAQQVTFFTPVTIDQIKVGISGPNQTGISDDGSFNVTLGPVLGTGTDIGSGDLVFGLSGPTVSEIFDFSGLNISLGPGTYYLQLSGGNVGWENGVQPLVTSAGTVGPDWTCDPTISCAADAWVSGSLTHAFEIDGTQTPEPSTIALFGTGMLGLAAVARRKFFHTHS
jgi:hypothetical protein